MLNPEPKTPSTAATRPTATAVEPSFVYRPSIAFRAHRNYLHSTTLYKELIAGAEAKGLVPNGPIELRVRRLIRYQPALHFSRSPLAIAESAPALFCLHAAGALWHGAVTESELPIINREDYDETPVTSRAVFSDTSIRLSACGELHPIEVITSMTLLLHQRRFTIGEDRKWYLARIELTRPLRAGDDDRIQIALLRRLGATMTRSSISSREQPLGHIEFIAGPVD